jgi:hypothetical protein
MVKLLFVQLVYRGSKLVGVLLTSECYMAPNTFEFFIRLRSQWCSAFSKISLKWPKFIP